MSSESSTSTETGSEDELMEIVNLVPRRRIYKPRRNPMIEYDEEQFKMRFRFSKTTILNFVETFNINEPEISKASNFPICPVTQLLITLRFYATGSFQEVLADHININKSTVCRIIPKITEKIASRAREFIRMPRAAEIATKVGEFYSIVQFPKVTGAIDCTHIKISSPGGNNPELYRNRKGWFSINVQAVCDANLKFMDIVARWPGSTHDSRIFNASELCARLEMGEFNDYWLLGDSGYACKPFLLTPVINPTTQAEENYNRAHIRTRNTIERSFGVWKRRFACLSMGLRLKPEKVVDIIVATAILHNLSVTTEDRIIEPIPEDAVDVEIVNDGDVHIRRAVINTIFTQ